MNLFSFLFSGVLLCLMISGGYNDVMISFPSSMPPPPSQPKLFPHPPHPPPFPSQRNVLVFVIVCFSFFFSDWSILCSVCTYTGTHTWQTMFFLCVECCTKLMRKQSGCEGFLVWDLSASVLNIPMGPGVGPGPALHLVL